MLAVTYNPEVINSDAVLAHVSQRGIQAKKVGM